MRFVKESVIRASCERVFAFHEQPDALRLLSPPWQNIRIIQTAQISEIGSRAVVELKIFGLFKSRWVAEHTIYDPPNVFEDIQIAGPFRSWRHRHIVERYPNGALLKDVIDFQLPLGILGRALAPVLILKRLQRLFNYRHEVTKRWCEKQPPG